MRGELIVLIWLAVAVSLLVLIQVVVLAALAAMIYKAMNKARQIERNLQASGVDLYAVAGTSYRFLQTLQTAIEESVESVHAIKEWSAGVHARLLRIHHALRAGLDVLKRRGPS